MSQPSNWEIGQAPRSTVLELCRCPPSPREQAIEASTAPKAMQSQQKLQFA